MEPTELRAAIEAILFVSNEPVNVDDLVDAFSDDGREAVIAQLDEIKRILDANVGGFMLEQTAGGWRLATRAEHDPTLKKYFAKKGESRLSIAALETLAIIAYRQPVTAPEVSEIRGVNSNGVIRTLLERRMIRVAGRKNVVGSPFLYRTTRDFLVHFGLNDIRDLPALEEFGDLIGDNIGDDIVAAIAASEQASPAADAAALEVPITDEAAATAEAEAELSATEAEVPAHIEREPSTNAERESEQLSSNADDDAVESSGGEQRE